MSSVLLEKYDLQQRQTPQTGLDNLSKLDKPQKVLWWGDPWLIDNAVFMVQNKRKFLMKKTCFCLGGDSLIRKVLAKIVLNSYFDDFVTLCITINSAMIASRDYTQKKDVDYESSWNDLVENFDRAFTVIYVFECIAKITVLGFYKHKRAYFRSGWNILDFVVVVIGLTTFLPAVEDQSAFKALRAARVLKPLRPLGKFPAMKILLATMRKAVPGLINVCAFFVFIIAIFGILGINLFRGTQYNFCRATEAIIDDGISDPIWPINSNAEWLCTYDENCSGFPNKLGLETVAKCGSVFKEYGMDSRVVDKTDSLDIIAYDTFNFNNIFKSCLMTFQVVSLEGWSGILYSYMDSANRVGAFLFFTTIVIIGNFVTLNLFLAEVMHSFLEAGEEIAENEIEEKAKEETKQDSKKVGVGKVLPIAE